MDNVVINITEIQDNVQITLNECITEVVTDGVTVTGNGTMSNPLVAVVGSGDMMRATYDPTNKNTDAFSMENMVEGATKKILTSAERTKLNNLSGTNTGDQDLTPYLTSATAAATYQPIGAYLTTISGLNISQLTNDSGYITSAALSPFLTTTAAAATYQPILVSGTTIKTINGTSLLGSGDITISASAALSSITAATAANTIDNGLNKQEWQFNSHVSGSAFKLSAALNAAHTPVMGAAVFGVTLSNSYYPPFSGTNYAAKFVNNYYASGGYNTAVAGYFETGDPYDYKHSAVYARGNIRIEASTGKLYFGNYTRIHGANGSLIFSPSTFPTNNAGSYTYAMEAGYSSHFIRNFSSTTYTNWQTSYLFKDISTSRQVIAFGVDSDLYTTAGVGTSYGWIERNADKLMFAAQAGLSSRTPITPNYLLTCYGTNSNVGIGTTTPNSSAKLDVSSTTQGFAPPEMTATQASAISTTSRKLIIYVTDTNGTFTSAGLWMWNGATWKLILAQ